MEEQTILQRAFQDGHAKLTGEGRAERIHYLAVGHSERWSDPEEKVRAEYWAELIYRYQYPPERIGIEVTVPDRTPRDSADLVVFNDDERKSPYAVIECKRDGITDAELKQATEQAFGNGHAHKFRATYVGVVAGQSRLFFDCSDKFAVLERQKNRVADLPIRYGKPLRTKFRKGDPQHDIAPVPKERLIAALSKCHDTIWNGGEFAPPAAFSEMCKLIFVKIADERDTEIGKPYVFQIVTNEDDKTLGQRIRKLYDNHRQRDAEVFNEDIKVSDSRIATVVAHLESLSLSTTDLDTKGLAFEKFEGGFFKGDAGQYFTPRELVEFCVQMMQPSAWERVLDPCCGSGGFLLHALDAVRNEANRKHEVGEPQHWAHWHDFAQRNLFGIEINRDIARVAKMNMIVHDDGHTNVMAGNALRPIGYFLEQNAGLKPGSFDLILTNPPFGANAKDADIPTLKDEFELFNKEDARGRRKPLKQQKSEILFLERIGQFLKPGTGRAAVVVPDGILTNSSLQNVRDWLLAHFQVLAVVSLPQFAFAHYGAGVKASLLFLRKLDENETVADDKPIFMALAGKVGYDATGRATDNELPDILDQYRRFERNPEPFFV
ncbi:MAG: restriction endonuclease subunit M [Gammaproteobacteria bacterium]